MSKRRESTAHCQRWRTWPVISAGAVIEDDALIGVKSKLPEGKRVGKKETWFGSPAMSIPNRQKVAISANFTYQPPVWFKAFRYVFEALHTSLPTALFISMAYITADVIAVPLETGDWGLAIAYFLASGIIMAIVAILFCAALKWVLMGVYKPVMKPMWSFWAMRTEAVAVLYGGLVGKASSEFLRGTPPEVQFDGAGRYRSLRKDLVIGGGRQPAAIHQNVHRRSLEA